ncbi:MAG: hypothetical protein ACI85O_000171 [Saprospiraceae bacterium]|jgi:hypothetical protein
MKKIFLMLTLTVSLTACDPQTLQTVLDSVSSATGVPLSQEEVGKGLKQALDIGITKGAQSLSKQDGYFKSPYKILLPAEIRKVTQKLKGVPGFSNLEQNLLEKINRGAEDAAKKAAPIFKTAISQMTFADAFNILKGNKNAATTYLNTKTNSKLYSEFNPVIGQSLDKFNARKIWTDAAKVYNKIPFVEKVNADLGDYVTKQALNGLFGMVAKKELDIRTNVASRTTDLLKKVFAAQDK